MAVMLIGRAAQGLGGGGLLALSYVAVARLFPDRLMPRLMALISAIWGVSALCGPLIGGVFASMGFWRGGFWAFALQAAVLILAALILLRPEQERADRTAARPPYVRLALLAAATLAIAEAGVRASLGPSLALGLAGLLLLWWFLRRDAGAADAILPAGGLDIRLSTGAGLIAVFTLSAATISFTTYGPFLMSLLHGADPLVGGYMVALESAAWSVAAIVTASAGARLEPRLIRWGAVTIVLGIVGFALVMPQGPVGALAPWALLQGAGFGMAWAFIIRRVVAGAAASDRERAASALPTAQLIGYALGSALSGMVANALGFADGATPEEGRAAGFWVFAAFLPLAAVGLVAAWRLAGPVAASGSLDRARGA